MTKRNNEATPRCEPVTMTKPVLIGAVIGLIAISFFVFGVDNPGPEWGKLWRIRPLIVTPAAGAAGGLFYWFMDYLSCMRGLNRTVAVILSLIVFVVGLWMGTVLGLAGTLWH